MSYSIQNLLTDLSGSFHGTTINKVPNIYGVISRSARELLLDIDPKETSRTVQMPQIFNSIYDYALPSDLKGDAIIDLKPQAGRTPSDQFNQWYSKSFDANKSFQNKNAISVEWNGGIKTIRIEADSLTHPTTICDTGSITGWSPAVTLTTGVAGAGALQFNLPAQASYSEAITTLYPIDLSGHLNVSTLFLWVYMPNGSGVTSLDLRWGSSASAYYTGTATETQQNTAFQDGWNLLAFPWTSVVGSPDVTKVTYSRINFNYNGTAQTGVKICNLVSALGYIYDLKFYSKYLFRDASTGVFQESVSDVTDNTKLINLDTDSYNMLLNKTSEYVAQSLQGADSAFDFTFFNNKYNNGLVAYSAKYPSERLVKAEPYYTFNRKNRYR